jgi:dipeptidyl aminopeptidase/acylaminoacyl peptidase
MGAKRAGWILIGVIAVAAFGVSAIATATFPGRSGRIAFSDGTDIFTMNPDGSDVRQLTSVGPTNFTCCHAWSPDGRQIVFSMITPSAQQLWVMNADGSDQHLVFDDPSNADAYPSFSPDGNYIVFVQSPLGFNQSAISRIRTDGTDLTPLTNISPDPDVFDLDPVYSPDGRSIAFNSHERDGLIEAIFLMNADGSDIRSLTPPALGAARPDWAPGGNKVAFQTGFLFANPPPCIATSAIATIRANGNGEEPLTGSPDFNDAFPSWSPQGDAIVFARTDSQGQSSIYVLDLGHRDATPVLIHQGMAGRTSRSPLPRHGAKGHGPQPIEVGGTDPRWGPAS